MKNIINECYEGVIRSRYIMFKTHHKTESLLKFKIKSLGYSGILIIKFIFSRFYRKKKYNNYFAFHWSHYKDRLLDYDQNIPIVFYSYKKFSRDQIELFKYIKLEEVLKNFFFIKKVITNEKNCDNIFYRIVSAFEFNLIKNILLENKIKHIVIYGLNDRYTIYISKLCEIYNIKLSIVQHGALTKFEGTYKINADEFLYMYSFSKNYLKYFFKNHQTIKILPCPRRKINLELKEFKGEKNIGYACTPSNIELNFKIIDILLNELSSDVNILVHPHPRENKNIYIERYKSYSNVFITKTKYINIKFLITRISSLGVDLKKLGIEPIFLNLEGHETDFLDSGLFISFSNLLDYHHWVANVLKKEFISNEKEI